MNSRKICEILLLTLSSYYLYYGNTYEMMGNNKITLGYLTLFIKYVFLRECLGEECHT